MSRPRSILKMATVMDMTLMNSTKYKSVRQVILSIVIVSLDGSVHHVRRRPLHRVVKARVNDVLEE